MMRLLALLFILFPLSLFADVGPRIYRVGVVSLRPLAFVNHQGDFRGIFIDFLNDLAKKEGWQLRFIEGDLPSTLQGLREKRLDLAIDIPYSSKLAKEFDFPKTHFITNWGQVLTRPSKALKSLVDLEGKKIVGVQNDFFLIEFINQSKNFLTPPQVFVAQTEEEALNRVVQRKADAAIISRLFDPERLEGLMLQVHSLAIAPTSLDIAIPRWQEPSLLQTLEKHLLKEQANKASKYNMALEQQYGEMRNQDQSSVFLLLGFFGVLVLFFLGVSLVLKSQVSLRTADLEAENEARLKTEAELQFAKEGLEARVAKRTLELTELNQTLEQRVKQEVQRRLEQEKLLIQQSKLASMGEMLSMIAHQWRQPLSTISTLAGGLKVQLSLGDPSPEKLDHCLSAINEHAQFLSRTINDFRDFFNPKKKQEKVVLARLLDQVVGLIGKSLETQSIQLVQNYAYKQSIVTYPNELMQVCLNILTNARDALDEKKVSKPKIILSGGEAEQGVYISISDNGGGISDEVMGKIFDAYFTTKHANRGTGLGLYMAKTIVEQHCKGSLTVKNTTEGAQFRISLPLNMAEPI